MEDPQQRPPETTPRPGGLPRLSGLVRETTQTTPLVLDVVDEDGAVVGRVNLRVEGAGPVIAVPIPGAPRLPE